MRDLATRPTLDLGPVIDLAQEAAELAQGAKSANTRKAYDREWRAFVRWCGSIGRSSLPAEPATVALFVADQAKSRKPAGLDVALAAIAAAHKVAGLDNPIRHPAVRAVREGARRKVGTAQRQAAPMTVDLLEVAIAAIDTGTLAGIRDRAILLLGFAGAFRRSELAALDLADIRPVAAGLEVVIRRSKTDQTGAGRTVAIPRARRSDLCPVAAVDAWRRALGELAAGPLFRAIDRHGNVSPAAISDRTIAEVIKGRARRAGLDPERISGHSLRAGLATSAAIAGVAERVIQQTTGHKSSTVLRRYIRGADMWRETAAGAVL
jgi:integrase